MTDAEVKKKAREALDRAKNNKYAILRKIRKLQAEIDNEDVVILSCLAILDEIEEGERGNG